MQSTGRCIAHFQNQPGTGKVHEHWRSVLKQQNKNRACNNQGNPSRVFKINPERAKVMISGVPLDMNKESCDHKRDPSHIFKSNPEKAKVMNSGVPFKQKGKQPNNMLMQ